MPQGLVTTYDLNVGVIVNIEDMIVLLDPADVPLLGIGQDGGPYLSRGTDVFEKKYEWLDDTLLTPRSTCASGINNVATTITIPAADANKFTVGDVVATPANEQFRVTAVDTTGLSLTITRAFGGTVAAAIATNDVLVGVGTALPEGSDPGTARSVDRQNRFNFTQIFGPHPVQVSATENIIRKYGLRGTTEFNYQAGQRVKEIMIGLEQACLLGNRFEDTTNKIRTMGGMAFYITTNVDSTTTAITDTALVAQAQAAFDAGGSPKVVLAGSAQKRKISLFESSVIRRTGGDNERGVRVDEYMTDFGDLSVKLDRWVRKTDLFGYDPEQVELETLRPLQFEMLAKTGDSIKGQIVGEYTLAVRRQKHAFRFSALT